MNFSNMVRGYDKDGEYIGKEVCWSHMPAHKVCHFLVFRRRKLWLVFELDHPQIGVIPEKALFRRWAAGENGWSFPTLTAARAFIKLKGPSI